MITADVQGLTPGSDISLFEVDGTNIGAVILRFHGYAHAGSVWWQGQEFVPWPIQAEGFARTSERPPTPTLTVSNLNGTISAICAETQDMVGAKVTRHRTLVKYLDAENFYGESFLQNGTFANGDDGWTLYEGFSEVVSGQMFVGQDVGNSLVYTEISTDLGVSYAITYDVHNSFIYSKLGTLPGAGDILGMHYSEAGHRITRYFTGTGGVVYLQLYRAALGGGTLPSFDNVTVRQYIGNPTADPDEHFPPEIWYIERRAGEEDDQVKFELTGYDLNGVKLPRRVIVPNHCRWEYRSADCGYTGPAVATINDTPTSDPALDRCSHKLRGCIFRWGEDNELPFGGFPAAGLMRS